MIINAINNCTHDSYSDFEDQLKPAFDSGDWFIDEDKLESSVMPNRGFASLFPTAYAASEDYSPEVEDIIADIYGVDENDADEADTAFRKDLRFIRIPSPSV